MKHTIEQLETMLGSEISAIAAELLGWRLEGTFGIHHWIDSETCEHQWLENYWSPPYDLAQAFGLLEHLKSLGLWVRIDMQGGDDESIDVWGLENRGVFPHIAKVNTITPKSMTIAFVLAMQAANTIGQPLAEPAD